MSAKTLMIQGTSSDAGKSLMVAGLCRVLANRGQKVAPFKPQNMALNSAVTPDGGEIGRAQAVQAVAARTPLQTDFNPVLLKPSTDKQAQVIIHGKPVEDLDAVGYHNYKKVAMTSVLESHERLIQSFSWVVVEGAGSPAEINLREGDIANMGFAEAVDCPVVLVADIDRGGVFAQIVGTLELLSPSERNRVSGFIINKFRGDIALLESGLEWLEKKTGKPVFGVLPFLKGLEVAAEDAIEVQQCLDDVKLKVVVPVLSRISNHTDFDPLRTHPQIELVFTAPGKPLPAADLIILPGTKSTCADLEFLRAQGWEKDIERHLRYGGKLMGICGGYQMLGEKITDPNAVEGQIAAINGLNYLPIQSQFYPQKTLQNRQGALSIAGETVAVDGYEIHQGHSEVTTSAEYLIQHSDGSKDGLMSQDGQIFGCYLHGIFAQPKAVKAIMAWAGSNVNETQSYQQQQEAAIERLAKACEEHLAIDKMINMWKPL